VRLFASGFTEGGEHMTTALPNQQPNRVLRCLSNTDLALIQPYLEPVELTFRKRLQSVNRKIRAVYFPESGLGSVVAVSGGERRQAEVGIIGREGMTGLAIVHGTDRSPCEIFVQVEGAGQCITADNLREVLDKSPSILRCVLRSAHVFGVQSSYTALANAHGTVEERCSRWLLMSHDRLEGDELHLTHEFLALMLGVRRAGVSIALSHLEGRGLIETARGAVTIVDRDGLEERANGLYGVPEAEFERLFG
jgi:CRP-like cAMP-binding protein